jgi:hypothetical protein
VDRIRQREWKYGILGKSRARPHDQYGRIRKRERIYRDREVNPGPDPITGMDRIRQRERIYRCTEINSGPDIITSIDRIRQREKIYRYREVSPGPASPKSTVSSSVPVSIQRSSNCYH